MCVFICGRTRLRVFFVCVILCQCVDSSWAAATTLCVSSCSVRMWDWESESEITCRLRFLKNRLGPFHFLKLARKYHYLLKSFLTGRRANLSPLYLHPVGFFALVDRVDGPTQKLNLTHYFLEDARAGSRDHDSFSHP